MAGEASELTTVAQFASLGAAQAAQALLAAQGIQALVCTNDTLRFDPFRPRSSLEIRLQVQVRDAVEARALLASFE